MMRTLEQIKVGDRVWIHGRYSTDKRIQTVTRLTPKQILVEGYFIGKAGETGSEYNRYWRGRKTKSGDLDYGQARQFHSDRITAIATKAECDNWDAEQIQKAEKQASHEAEQDRVAAKRIELRNLFEAKHWVSLYQDDHAEGWQVEFGRITEEQIHQLAEFWNALNSKTEAA